MSKVQVSARCLKKANGRMDGLKNDSLSATFESNHTGQKLGTSEVSANWSYTLPMINSFERSSKNTSALCSSPNRYKPVQAGLPCITKVFNNPTLFVMIMGYHRDDSVYPLTDFARKMDMTSFRPVHTRRRNRSEQKKAGRKRVRDDSDSDDDNACEKLPMLLTLTQVCWNWYANGPNHLYTHPVAVSKSSGTCPENLRVRLSERCRAFCFVPGEVVHVFSPRNINPLPVDSIYVHMFANLHTIFLEDGPITGFMSWLHMDSASLKTRALTLLCTFQTLRRFSILVDNEEHVQLLGQMTHIRMLHLDAHELDNNQNPLSLSPLQTLTQLRYLQLKNSCFDDVSTFVNALSALEVLDTYWRCDLDSMHGLTSLRQYCVERALSGGSLYDTILTLPESNNNVDIQIRFVDDDWFRKRDEAAHRKAETLCKLMRRFCLGFRVFREGGENTFYTFAPHRWPTRPRDITEPFMVDQLIRRLYGIDR